MKTHVHTPDGIILVDIPDPDLDRIRELLATSPAVISMPEIWELLRLFAKKQGYIDPE